MLPTTLQEWSIEKITELLGMGYYESERFDFKEMLPHRQDKSGKHRLTKTCCAFANSAGGFLVFGIADDISLSPEERLVGLSSNSDFPEHFGAYPQQGMPGVEWSFLNPPLCLPNGNLIHVVEIQRSWRMPHCCAGMDNGLVFSKRTNRGTEEMSYDEVKMMFLGFQERLMKVQLLLVELTNIAQDARLMIIAEDRRDKEFSLLTFDFSRLDALMLECYIVLAKDLDLIASLNLVQSLCRRTNNRLLYLQQQVALPIADNIGEIMLKHNTVLAELCHEIIRHSEGTRSKIQKLLLGPMIP